MFSEISKAIILEIEIGNILIKQYSVWALPKATSWSSTHLFTSLDTWLTSMRGIACKRDLQSSTIRLNLRVDFKSGHVHLFLFLSFFSSVVVDIFIFFIPLSRERTMKAIIYFWSDRDQERSSVLGCYLKIRETFLGHHWLSLPNTATNQKSKTSFTRQSHQNSNYNVSLSF